jgi:hypothetical protein
VAADPGGHEPLVGVGRACRCRSGGDEQIVPAGVQVTCGLTGSRVAGSPARSRTGVAGGADQHAVPHAGRRGHWVRDRGPDDGGARRTGRFLSGELGELAAAHPGTDALHETVRGYLETNRSAARSAEIRYIGKNMVLYRVRKVEEILGRGLARDKLRLHLVLYLSQLLGPLRDPMGPDPRRARLRHRHRRHRLTPRPDSDHDLRQARGHPGNGRVNHHLATEVDGTSCDVDIAPWCTSAS